MGFSQLPLLIWKTKTIFEKNRLLKNSCRKSSEIVFKSLFSNIRLFATICTKFRFVLKKEQKQERFTLEKFSNVDTQEPNGKKSDRAIYYSPDFICFCCYTLPDFYIGGIDEISSSITLLHAYAFSIYSFILNRFLLLNFFSLVVWYKCNFYFLTCFQIFLLFIFGHYF